MRKLKREKIGGGGRDSAFFEIEWVRKHVQASPNSRIYIVTVRIANGYLHIGLNWTEPSFVGCRIDGWDGRGGRGWS